MNALSPAVEARRRRTFAIISHPDAGKSTLTEALALHAHVISEAGAVHGKAGRKRWLGRRPRNRGVSMNPVDHPMGGGEGRSSGGHPRSRKGLLAKGYKTRDPKKTTSKFIVSRRKK